MIRLAQCSAATRTQRAGVVFASALHRTSCTWGSIRGSKPFQAPLEGDRSISCCLNAASLSRPSRDLENSPAGSVGDVLTAASQAWLCPPAKEPPGAYHHPVTDEASPAQQLGHKSGEAPQAGGESAPQPGLTRGQSNPVVFQRPFGKCASKPQEHFTPIRMGDKIIIQRRRIRAGEDAENSLVRCWRERKMGQLLWKTAWQLHRITRRAGRSSPRCAHQRIENRGSRLFFFR